jgi:hypothetical protein
MLTSNRIPVALEYRLLHKEQELHRGWEEPLPYDACRSQYIEREQQEWEQAAVIPCGSEFVRKGIHRCNHPGSRCVVVLYGVDARFQIPIKVSHTGSLQISTRLN